MLLLLLSISFISGCKKESELDQTPNKDILNIYSNEELGAIKNWMIETAYYGDSDEEIAFPELNYHPKFIKADEIYLNEYINAILYLKDNLLHGREINYNLDFLIKKISQDDIIKNESKKVLYSAIQLTLNVLVTEEYLEILNKNSKVYGNVLRSDPCNCSSLYDSFLSYQLLCQTYGEVFGVVYCDWADYYYNAYQDCLGLDIVCPSGFTFDGHNCWSHEWYPSGYHGFIYGNGFYTKQNCSISTSNDCCPPSFNYDGANCHYWGLYFPWDYEAFIYENGFFVKPKCE